MVLTSLLGLGTTLAIIVFLILKRYGGQTVRARIWFPFLVVLGTLTGLGTSLMTFLLMVFKNGQHGHLVPDFPGTMVVDLLSRAPAWTLAGTLLGVTLSLTVIALAPHYE